LTAGGILWAVSGASIAAGICFLTAAVVPAWALRIFQKPQALRPFPISFVRAAYVWLCVGAALSIWSALADKNGGIVGSPRHALTVGFVGTMVFSFGPRILPAFCGEYALCSKHLATAALLLLNSGCLLRVTSEIPAYEANFAAAWTVLPISAVIELTAVTLFALNIAASFIRKPASQHVLAQAAHSFGKS
jgi:uncharacterized protein involved in response to NO